MKLYELKQLREQALTGLNEASASLSEIYNLNLSDNIKAFLKKYSPKTLTVSFQKSLNNDIKKNLNFQYFASVSSLQVQDLPKFEDVSNFVFTIYESRQSDMSFVEVTVQVKDSPNLGSFVTTLELYRDLKAQLSKYKKR